MTGPSLAFRVLAPELAVVRLPLEGPLPEWACRGEVWAVVGSPGERSAVCPAGAVPPGAPAEAGWVALRLEGPFAFDQVGILAGFLRPLAEAGVAVFALSTFDTDLVLVKRAALERALGALETAGHRRVGTIAGGASPAPAPPSSHAANAVG